VADAAADAANAAATTAANAASAAFADGTVPASSARSGPRAVDLPPTAEGLPFRPGTYLGGNEVERLHERIARMQHAADLQYGTVAALKAAELNGEGSIDPVLAGKLQEEGRLQRILHQQVAHFKEAEEKLRRANDPDPRLEEYTTALNESVLVEVQTREVQFECRELHEQMDALQQRLSLELEVQQLSSSRLQDAQLHLATLAPENAAMGSEIARIEARLAQARSAHAQESTALRISIADGRERARAAETELADLEVEVARLDAEVRWYRLRLGEEFPGGPDIAHTLGRPA